MKKIPLTQGKFAIVDDDDYPMLVKHNWHALKSRGTYYARRKIGTNKLIQMHRLILNADITQQIDHINGNGLDNRKNNMRLCTHAQNNMNKNKIWSKSGFKGVTLNHHKWSARITVNNKIKYLGRYKNIKDAARAYDLAAIKFFGNFAKTNEQMGLLKRSSK